MEFFFGGTILASKRTDYQADDPDQKVQKMMQEQHKALLKEVLGGLLDGVRWLSMTPASFAAVKRAIRAASGADLEREAVAALDEASAAAVRARFATR